MQVKIVKLDYICVDYLDLLTPASAKVSPNDQFIKDKYVSEELRNLAKEMDFVMVTASQLNRAAVEEIEFDPILLVVLVKLVLLIMLLVFLQVEPCVNVADIKYSL